MSATGSTNRMLIDHAYKSTWAFKIKMDPPLSPLEIAMLHYSYGDLVPKDIQAREVDLIRKVGIEQYESQRIEQRDGEELRVLAAKIETELAQRTKETTIRVEQASVPALKKDDELTGSTNRILIDHAYKSTWAFKIKMNPPLSPLEIAMLHYVCSDDTPRDIQAMEADLIRDIGTWGYESQRIEPRDREELSALAAKIEAELAQRTEKGTIKVEGTSLSTPTKKDDELTASIASLQTQMARGGTITASTATVAMQPQTPSHDPETSETKHTVQSLII